MQPITLNMAQTLALAIIILVIGKGIKKKVQFFQKYFIPAPVIGGILFSLMTLAGHNTGMFQFKFESQLKDLLMIAFFTTVGFSASLKTLKQGGIQVATFLFVATIFIFVQNGVGIVLAKAFGLHPLLGVAAGSIPLIGGHGTSGAFGPVLENAGVKGAFSVAIASATYGLIAGSLVGGPVARRLMVKNNLKCKAEEKEVEKSTEEKVEPMSEQSLFYAVILLSISMGVGVYVGQMFKMISPKIVLPAYIGSMLVAAIIRNILDMNKRELPKQELDVIGNIALSIFLSMALMTLALWELAALAIPLITILLAQTAAMGLYAYYITFNVMGRDYDAAAMATGHCGFGLGSTANAMANMEAFTSGNGPSVKAFLVIPIVGAMFIDFANAAIITALINMFS